MLSMTCAQSVIYISLIIPLCSACSNANELLQVMLVDWRRRGVLLVVLDTTFLLMEYLVFLALAHPYSIILDHPIFIQLSPSYIPQLLGTCYHILSAYGR